MKHRFPGASLAFWRSAWNIFNDVRHRAVQYGTECVQRIGRNRLPGLHAAYSGAAYPALDLQGVCGGFPSRHGPPERCI